MQEVTFGLHFLASHMSAFERMYHIGQQDHSCFLAFQLVAFTQQAKVRIKMSNLSCENDCFFVFFLKETYNI